MVGAARDGAKDSRGQEIGHGFAERTTFIVTPDGKVAATVGGVSPADNVDEVARDTCSTCSTPGTSSLSIRRGRTAATPCALLFPRRCPLSEVRTT